MTASNDPIADRATLANGPASLTERVRGLRLSPDGGVPAARGGSGWLPWLLCLIMAITWSLFAIRAYSTGGLNAMLGRPAPNGGPAPVAAADAPKKDKTTVPTAAGSPDEMVHEVKGTIVASRQIQVGPDRVSGRVTRLEIVEGKFFKAGDALAEIDKTDYEAEYSQMRAMRESLEAQVQEMENGSRPEEKAQALAQVEEAQALLDQYQRDLVRYEDLKKKGLTISDKEFDLASSNVKIQEAKLKQIKNTAKLVVDGPRKEKIDSMRAQLAQARAREKQTKEMLDRCIIRAPVDGIILSKRTEVGNLVNPLAMNTQFNGGICEMADLTDLEVDLEIQERDIRKIFVGQACYVRADAYQERRYDARVDRIMPIANSSKAVIPIRVKVRVPRSEEGQYLKPQAGAIVNFYSRKAGPDGEAKPPTIIEQ